MSQPESKEPQVPLLQKDLLETVSRMVATSFLVDVEGRYLVEGRHFRRDCCWDCNSMVVAERIVLRH